MASIEDARQRLGEVFLMGFKGLELSDDTSAFLSQAGIGGVILFSHNYENPGQVAELINQIQECRRELPLWISVDHEGGKVQRFRKPFTKIPEAAAIGFTDSPKLAFEIGELIAKELAAVGINLNYCPVADIATNPKNPIIGTRAYGTTEDRVSKIVTAIVRGHLVHKVQACVKHFPGHGDTSTDSHLALPKIDTDLKTLQDRELKPFIRAFKSRCQMVMTAHIVVKSIDPHLPATLSSKILKDLLRKEIRYNRIVLSDDMEMQAITDHFGAEEAPRLALQAGCDVLIYRSEEACRKAYTSVLDDLNEERIEPETIIEAAERSRSLKKEFLLPYHAVNISEVSGKIGTPENIALMEKIEKDWIEAGKPF